jgi:GT2 family glycosyltransferase
MDSDPRLGFVIVDWKTPRLAAACSESIRTLRPRSEILTVNAAGASLGYAQALNAGIGALCSEADVIVCLNADTRMLEADDAILDLFDRDPDLAIIGPRQINARRQIVHGGIVQWPDGTPWDLDLRHRCWHQLVDQPHVDALTRMTFEVPTVAGSVIYCRRRTLSALGGWPEFSRYYYEDTGLCLLARHHQRRVLYTGSVTWEHLHEGSPLRRSVRTHFITKATGQFIAWSAEQGIPLNIEPDAQRVLARDAGVL